ncbi:bacteriohemerythrin [Propionivibrio sp.]|uniref:bacteriohemerythrin n=1 Tax=Propionivibrio sp. TaxID=2212460 RepID=UPI003BF2C4C6
MSTISDFNQKSCAVTDGEHRIQLELLQALCAATQENCSPASAGEILQQLVSYSEAHFMSEELLMRLKSYDDYEDHVSDHIHMMEVLAEIESAHASGKSALVSGQAESVLEFIKQHIATRDQRFADFMLAEE